MAEMLAALSSAPAPLEHFHFADSFVWFFAGDAGHEIALDVARSLQTALLRAPLRSLQLDYLTLFRTWMQLPDPVSFPHLQEFEVTSADHMYSEDVMQLVHTCRGLKKLCCNVWDEEALRKLSALSLEELRVLVFRTDVIEGALEALKPDCVRGLGLDLEIPGNLHPLAVSGEALTTILRFRYLENLSAWVDHTSGDLLAMIGSLQKLSTLRLDLKVFYAPDGGAELLRAAAAGIGAAPLLQSLSLCVDGSHPDRDFILPDVDPAVTMDHTSLAALIRAARPSLESLNIVRAPAAAEVVQEVVRVGPKLKSLHIHSKVAGIDELGVFRELASLPESNLQVSFHAQLNDSLYQEACDLLRGWFEGTTRKGHGIVVNERFVFESEGDRW
eukprot:tig00021332_g20323.t1